MGLYDEMDIKMLLMRMREVESTFDAFETYCIYASRFKNLKVVLSLDGFAAHDSFGKFETISKIDHVIPYYRSHQVLVLSEETVRAAAENKKADIPVDHTVMFDTNVANYISTMFRGRPLGNNHDRVIKLMDAVIYGGYNFDHIFYMLESIKFIRVNAERWVGGVVGFWQSLNKGFRWNLSALMYFRMIKCDEYVKNSKLVFDCSFRQAVREARHAAFNYYASADGKEMARQAVLMQRELLLLLLIAVRINFSSKRSPQDKFKQLLSEVQSVVGVFHERELSILLAYFSDSKSLKILGTINKGGKNRRLLKKVDNIAWDFYTPRAMELIINSVSAERIMLPFLATFDDKLVSMMRMFPVKGSVLSVEDGLHLPFRSDQQRDFFEDYGVVNEVAGFFTNEMVEARASNRSANIEIQFVKIKEEYRKLRIVMRS